VWFVVLSQSGVSIFAACTPTPAIAGEVMQSAAVFRGRVVSLEALPDNTASIATFDVEQWWKGGLSRTVNVLSCGGKPSEGREIICTDGPYKFHVGGRYVVFAVRHLPTNPFLEASSCRRTAAVEKSADNIRWLNTNMSNAQ
jgi:hypothetical protein